MVGQNEETNSAISHETSIGTCLIVVFIPRRFLFTNLSAFSGWRFKK